MSEKEKHPHLHLFDAARAWKYLVIGTFPPNTAIRKKFYIDFFYGNKGSLWKILHDIYKCRGYDFFNGTPAENLAEIKRWQQDYCVGFSDTIISCARRHPLASDDADLLETELNFSLKDYIHLHFHNIRKIIFTGTFAYQNFKKIMGGDLEKVSPKLVTDLPSPSGAGNISFVNTSRADYLGLTADLYKYISGERHELLNEFEKRWELKKERLSYGKNSSIDIPAVPRGIVKAYKEWKYAQVFPTDKCL